jgi:hypothetical protein
MNLFPEVTAMGATGVIIEILPRDRRRVTILPIPALRPV